MADTTILIEDPDLVRDIHRLAAQRGEAVTTVVAGAIRDKLSASEQNRFSETEIEERRRKVAMVLAEIDALPHDGELITDEDLYDEDGMPR